MQIDASSFAEFEIFEFQISRVDCILNIFVEVLEWFVIFYRLFTGCRYGYYGDNCSVPCNCDDDCLCDHVTGSCNYTVSDNDFMQGSVYLHNSSKPLAHQLQLNEVPYANSLDPDEMPSNLASHPDPSC